MADETLVYTLLGEARGEGVDGMVAVANVIRNRAESGLFPSNPVDVVLQPWQFSTNNAGEGGNQAATRREVPVGSALYNTAARIVDLYIEGDAPPTDLTGGSLYYHTNGLPWRYANSVTTAYGTTTIGNHTFYPRHPVPQVNVGEADLLRGYTGAVQAPMPRNRGSRPGGYTTSNAQSVAMAREETRYMQRMAVLRKEMAAARTTALAANVVDEGIDVTPVLSGGEGSLPAGMTIDKLVDQSTRIPGNTGKFTVVVDPTYDKLDDPGNVFDIEAANKDELRQKLEQRYGSGTGMTITDRRSPFDVIYDPKRGGFITIDQRASDILDTRAGPAAPALGFGSILGRAFPMVPADKEGERAMSALPVGHGAPRRPLVSSGLRPGDVVAESGLIRRAVTTVKIDPNTGMPYLSDEPSTQPTKVTTSPPAWTSMGGSPHMTFLERVKFAQQYAEQTKAKTAGLAAPGAGLTAAERAAISGSGAPVPRPAGSRDKIAPVPMPASARPKVSTLAPLPVPAPLSSAIKPRASSGYTGSNALPASEASLTKIMAPKAATSTVKPLTASPVGHGAPKAPIVKSAVQRVDRTVVVHKDGSETVVPRAGSVAMPDGARPNVPKPAAAQPIIPGVGEYTAAAPKVSTATVVPQKPTAPPAPGLSAPGAGLTAAQRAAISGSGAPVPAVKSPAVTAKTSTPVPVVSTKTVTVSKPATSTTPKKSTSAGGGGSTSTTKAVVMAKGTATGTNYVVGTKLSNGNGTYVVGKDSKGNATFTRL